MSPAAVDGDERLDGFGERVAGGGGGVVVRVEGVEVDAVEERLVQDALGGFPGPDVHAVRVGQQVEDVFDVGCAAGQVRAVGLGEPSLELTALGAQVAHLDAEFLGGPVGVSDEVEVVVFADVESGELLLDLGPERGGGVAVLARGGVHGLRDSLPQLGRKADPRVVVLHGPLACLDGQVGQVAGVVLLAPAQVVEVAGAVLGLAGDEDQALVAAGAPHGALEVVVVDAGTGAAAALPVQDFLDFGEQFLADDRLVSSGVFGVLVPDVAEIEAVAQHGAELVDRDLVPGRVPLGRPGPQPGVGEGVAQGVVAVGAGGVQLERQAHQRGALGIDGDGAHFPTFELFAHVQISDGGAADRAASGDLLAHLVGDVRSRGARLVFVDAVQDGGHEVADGVVLGVVHDRDDDGSGFAQVPLGDRGVHAVAVHPAAGVDDDVIHVLLGLDPRHHLGELRPPLDRGGRAAGLHVFADDDRAELGGALLTR